MFGHDEETGIENENWSSLSAAMLTLFTYVTVSYKQIPINLDASNINKAIAPYKEINMNMKFFFQVDGWTDIQDNLNTRPYSQWFTISFIFLGHFIFTNLFIGIIIMVRPLLCPRPYYYIHS